MYHFTVSTSWHEGADLSTLLLRFRIFLDYCSKASSCKVCVLGGLLCVFGEASVPLTRPSLITFSVTAGSAELFM